MERKWLIKQLKKLGYRLEQERTKHEVWKKGNLFQIVPRSKKINNGTAKDIIRNAEKNEAA